MKIAIDGTAASGKGTLARRLAAELGLPYLDTGLIYRSLAFRLIEDGGDLSDEAAAAGAARALSAEDCSDRPALRTEAVGRAASSVSAFPQVREALLAFQRDFAARPGGAVLDGRDIGTVVLPDADVKFFVTASLRERARRRAGDLGLSGDKDIAAVGEELRARDERDMARTHAPMKAADDAYVIDTTRLSPAEVLRTACEIVDGVSGANN
ncbi:cytidylate kinase [Pacificimonas flava]|uniref:Cytidylate kinase n=2 Tax=Pacificimonas TaxID=1960290 RepID=A0A219B1A4_9SPHN|nr:MULTISPECIES: (d)CMP kinase [Pacificimonas]MBZ6378284.1 (d)CMP kinase [Pacificimonas aurantium]OWV32100.1 cytidylate kinase [Pacificimonas flava]